MSNYSKEFLDFHSKLRVANETVLELGHGRDMQFDHVFKKNVVVQVNVVRLWKGCLSSEEGTEVVEIELEHWANWIAVNKSGMLKQYERKPHLSTRDGIWYSSTTSGKTANVCKVSNVVDYTLTLREI